MIKPIFAILSLIFVFTSPQIVFADSFTDKVDFAGSLEETLGHFWALEQNLNDENTELAMIHAAHPISELYLSMKPLLKTADPDFDSEVETVLLELQEKASTDVSREQAQQAIDDAKVIVERARLIIVGEELSNSTTVKGKLIQGLLETSIAEYSEAVSDGAIVEMAEFQDGSAFVWRSQQIFNEIKSDIPAEESDEIDELYTELWAAYDSTADPGQVKTLANGIIHEIGEVIGEESIDKDLLDYVENIRALLQQTKVEYANGDTDLALSLVTRAYLDNYEFLEGPLVELDQRELMEEVEILLREDLRNMIKNNESPEMINSHIDVILDKMDTIAIIVPEFGTIAVMILVVAIISIITLKATRLPMIFNTR